MRPTSSTTIQRPDLASIAYEYQMESSTLGFIADLALPIFETVEKTADYPVIPAESVLKIPHNIKRAPRADYARDEGTFKMGTFNCEEFGLESPVDESEATLYRRYFDAEVVATKRVVNMLLRAREKRAAELLFNAGTFSGYTNGVDYEWDKPNDATPQADVSAAKRLIRNRTGLRANGMIISNSVFDALLVCKSFLAHVEKTRAVLLDNFETQKKLIAQFFGLEDILVGDAVVDSAKKGKSLSVSDIWDPEFALVGVFAKNPQDLGEPCVGRSFLWTSDSPSPVVVETYREEKKRSDIVRGRHNMDECPVFLAAGQLLSNITTSA